MWGWNVFIIILHSEFLIFIEKLPLMGDARGVTIDDKQQFYHSVISI